MLPKCTPKKMINTMPLHASDPLPYSPDFHFKKFSVQQQGAAHPVGTDSVLLGSWPALQGDFKHILDIGCGTGIIALMMAQRFATADIKAIEPHFASFECTLRNFSAAARWSSRLSAQHTTLQEYTKNHWGESFDLIVSNPPFFINSLSNSTTHRTNARHTNHLPYEDLIAATVRLLAPQGLLALILPFNESRLFRQMAAIKGLYYTQICDVYSFSGQQPERALMLFQKKPLPFQREHLVLYETPGCYTEAYKCITQDFYL